METSNTQKIKKFLPSKKFAIIIGILVLALVIVLVLSKFTGSRDIFNRERKALFTSNGTVSDLVTQDSNGNSIADWEETLWGLDPLGDGETNKAIIVQKKIDGGIDVNSEGDENLTETDKFSRDLFSTILALQQSGSLTEEAITNLAAAIGDDVDTKHVASKIYTEANFTLISPSYSRKQTYASAMRDLIEEHSDPALGSELMLIATGMGEGGETVMEKLTPIANAHAALAEGLTTIPTPSDILPQVVKLANAEAKMAVTLPQIQNIYKDALGGMVGLDDFVKASTDANDASTVIRVYFFGK